MMETLDYIRECLRSGRRGDTFDLSVKLHISEALAKQCDIIIQDALANMRKELWKASDNLLKEFAEAPDVTNGSRNIT